MNELEVNVKIDNTLKTGRLALIASSAATLWLRQCSTAVYGADFWCNRRCKTKPVNLEGFVAQARPTSERKSTLPGPPEL